MPHLSREAKRLIIGAAPKDSIRLPCGILELHSSSVADDLLKAGLLNIVVREASGQIKSCEIKDFLNSAVRVEGQENLKTPNASCITSVWLDGGTVYAQHWEGFVSRFDAATMRFEGQKFTK